MPIDVIEPPISRRDQRKMERRRAIVEAARQSFLEQGYAGTSMSGLLDTLGGSKETLWRYFRSKEELFAAVIEDIAGSFHAELNSVLCSDADLETALAAFCREFLGKIAAPQAISIWRLVIAESGRFPEIGRIFSEQAVQRTEQALAAFLAHHIATEALRDEDPQVMAHMLIGSFASLHYQMLRGCNMVEAVELNKVAARSANVFLRAFARIQLRI